MDKDKIISNLEEGISTYKAFLEEAEYKLKRSVEEVESLQNNSADLGIRLQQSLDTIAALAATGKGIIQPFVEASRLPTQLAKVSLIREMPVTHDELGGTYIYFLCYRGVVKYVGQSCGLMTRLRSHVKSKPLFDQIFYIKVDKDTVDEIEKHYIRSLGITLWNIDHNPYHVK